MSLLFIDGCDYYTAAQLNRKWTTFEFTPTIVAGRNGSGLYFNANNEAVTKTLSASHSTLIAGFAFKTEALGCQFFSFMDSSSTQTTIQINPTGELEFLRSTSISLGVTSGLGLSINTWYYLELKVTFHDTLGSYEVRLNTTPILSASGVNTQATANPTGNGVKYFTNYTPNNMTFDDIYVCDDSGSTNNDFLGDCKVEIIRPTGAGNQTDFTPSTGSNWENVDDAQPDDDSTYNYHAPQGLPGTDLFQMGDLTTISGSVFGIQPIISCRKDDAGSANLYSVIRTGGTDYVGSGISLGDSYIFHTDILETNPDTAVAWTVTDINNIEGGYRRTS
jgi:hypothetical protein